MDLHFFVVTVSIVGVTISLGILVYGIILRLWAFRNLNRTVKLKVARGTHIQTSMLKPYAMNLRQAAELAENLNAAMELNAAGEWVSKSPPREAPEANHSDEEKPQ